MADDAHATKWEAVRRTVLEGPGELAPDVRKAAEAYAAQLGGRARASSGAEGIPEALVGYVDKVARHAYKVVDRDIDDLKEAGFSENAIYEATVATAIGSAAGRLERGLAALEGKE